VGNCFIENSISVAFNPGVPRIQTLSGAIATRSGLTPITVAVLPARGSGRRRVSIGNTLTTEVSLDFIVPKGHSVKVVRLPSFVERVAVCTPRER
jgi:hypothetical protein